MIMTNFKINPLVECKHKFVAFGRPAITMQCTWCGMIKIHLGWLLMKIKESEDRDKLREEVQKTLER